MGAFARRNDGSSDISRMGFCKFCITQEQLEQMRQLSETPEATGRVPVNE